MTVRIFYTLFSLSQKEQARVREVRSAGEEDFGQVRIRYSRKRLVEDVEAESVQEAICRALNRSVPLEGVPGVYASYASVFGACEARDGEGVKELENCFRAEEVPLL